VLVDTGNVTIDSTLVATGDTTNTAMVTSNATNNTVMLAIMQQLVEIML